MSATVYKTKTSQSWFENLFSICVRHLTRVRIPSMKRTLFLETPTNFSFRHTVYGHGWCDLPPFQLDEDKWQLSYVFRDPAGNIASATISDVGGRLKVQISDAGLKKESLLKDVRHILRLDEPLDEFYDLTRAEERLSWIALANAGRLLRSSTVFEDLVKTLCTTNCSWALTKKMVTNLVTGLGREAVDGRKTFPTPEAMPHAPEKFYREVVRA